MLDTVGLELPVVKRTEHSISLEADTNVVLTPDQDKEATSNLLPINFTGLSKVIVVSLHVAGFIFMSGSMFSFSKIL